MTLGAITGSKAVVLDRGDILDAGNRAGLVAAVNRVASSVPKWRYCFAVRERRNRTRRGTQVAIQDGVAV